MTIGDQSYKSYSLINRPMNSKKCEPKISHFFPSSPSPVVNPYKKKLTMGIQSQKRDGAIRKCLKRGTARKKRRSKWYQTGVDGGDAFVPVLHCCVCKKLYQSATGKKVSIPHRAHDRRCPKNRKTRGMSAMTVFVNQEAERNIAANTAKICPKLDEESKISPWSKVEFEKLFFPKAGINPKKLTFDLDRSRSQDLKATSHTYGSRRRNFDCHLIPNIRDAMEDLVNEYLDSRSKKTNDFSWTKKMNCSVQMALAINYIVGLLSHKKGAATNLPLPATDAFKQEFENFRLFFPQGCCQYVFPPDSTTPERPPNPHYHVLEGQSFVYLDWKLIAPEITLNCPSCMGLGLKNILEHERTNYSKNRSLFPLWTNQGTPSWVIYMRYKWTTCNLLIPANDGRLLSSMPPHIAEIYPVSSHYSSGSFHMDKDLTFDLELLMTTYANSKFISEKLYKKLGAKYIEKCRTYLSKFPTTDFVPFDEFIAGFFPPSAQSIREYFQAAQYSNLTPYGYLEVDRFKREL